MAEIVLSDVPIANSPLVRRFKDWKGGGDERIATGNLGGS